MESLLVWKIRIGKLRGLERMFVVAIAFASDESEDSVTEAAGERRDDGLFRVAPISLQIPLPVRRDGPAFILGVRPIMID